ncbi:MAG: hypothetical protein ACR2JO_07395 [Mycobacteriales bacterium]
MRRTLIAAVMPMVALAIALSGCSGGSSSDSTPRAVGKSTPSGGPADHGTKAACANVQAALRTAPQALAPVPGNPQASLQAARALADLIEADVRDSDSRELKSAVGGVAQVFRDIAKAGTSGDTKGLVQNIQRVGQYGRQVAEICARARAGG